MLSGILVTARRYVERRSSSSYVCHQGGSELRNAQPFVLDTMLGPLGLAHNGTVRRCAESLPLRYSILDHALPAFAKDGDGERRRLVYFI